MKLIATVKLLCSEGQKDRLLSAMRRCNEACEWLGGLAFEAKTADKLRLQREYYKELRERFGLSAQMAVRAISKVCEAYKRDKTKRPRFKPLGAVAYDQRLYSFKGGLDRLSILCLDGRLLVPIAVGEYHQGRLEGARGQADLVYRGGTLYLFVTVEVPDGSPVEIDGTLGVDLGIRNLATDSDGKQHSGEVVEAVRQRYSTLRGALQKSGTKSAKRHLKKSSGKEGRFRADTNHQISKHLVGKAKGTGRRIALEDLSGIRGRVTVRKSQRASHCGWAFFQLRTFVTYKAALAGVPVILVDPRNTSRECLRCHYTAKENRKSQAEFCCVACGFTAHADVVGATNIARRADVNRPIVPRQPGESVNHPGTSRRFSGASPAL